MAKTQRILFISKGEQAPSTRYRAMAYASLLTEAGWTVDHLEAMGIGEMLRVARWADVVVVVRRRFSPIVARLLRRAAKRLVYDVDDAVFLKSDGSPSTKRSRGFDRMCRLADVVWAGNGYLADRARRVTDRVSVLPTSIDPRKYEHDHAKATDVFDAVWVGSSSTRVYVERLLPTLEQAKGRVANLRLKIVADFGLPSSVLPIVTVPWSSEGEASAVCTSHVGVGPLTDDPWTRGKCGLKLLQYMAGGLPVVADRVGANAEIITEATGFAVDGPQGWIDALVKLASDHSMRTAMGAAGRARVNEHYSIAATFRLMNESLNTLVAR